MPAPRPSPSRRRVTARSDSAFHGDALAITDDYLYVGENDYSERASQEIRRMLRLRLADLDSFATPL